MSVANIVNIILSVITIVALFLGYYFAVRAKLLKAASGAINNAEQDDKTGEEKRAIAIEQICALVPTFLKPLFSKTIIEGIVQAAFDKIEDYAEKQVKKKTANNP